MGHISWPAQVAHLLSANQPATKVVLSPSVVTVHWGADCVTGRFCKWSQSDNGTHKPTTVVIFLKCVSSSVLWVWVDNWLSPGLILCPVVCSWSFIPVLPTWRLSNVSFLSISKSREPINSGATIFLSCPDAVLRLKLSYQTCCRG